MEEAYVTKGLTMQSTGLYFRRFKQYPVIFKTQKNDSCVRDGRLSFTLGHLYTFCLPQLIAKFSIFHYQQN